MAAVKQELGSMRQEVAHLRALASKGDATTDHRAELAKCRRSPAYFLGTYCQVYDAQTGDWIPFRLWAAQAATLQTIVDSRLGVILKARQLGLTWLVLGFALWLLLFFPAATILLFSRRDDEATDLLATRLRGIHDRLPEWLQVGAHVTDNDHEWELANGSRVLAFPTTAGDSYSATLAIVDEADLVPDLAKLLRSVKPTIDAGGRLILLSRVDKSKPQSAFKKVYAAAKQRLNGWAHVFLPWHSRPDRDAAWYAAQSADVLHRTGSLDDLHEQYPATDAEALSPRTLDKRISPAWLAQCYRERRPGALPADAPPIPGLEVYALPWPGCRYVIGADPAEGNPTSDDSALTVMDAETGEETAALAGKFQPSVFAAHIDAVSQWYGGAPALVERNNHGHAVLLWLRDHTRVILLTGHDGGDGWLSSSKGKALLYDAAADAFREQGTVLHSFGTFTQLSSIEGATLRAPDGEHDDRADGYALACVARQTRPRSRFIEGDLLVWPAPEGAYSPPPEAPAAAATTAPADGPGSPDWSIDAYLEGRPGKPKPPAGQRPTGTPPPPLAPAQPDPHGDYLRDLVRRVAEEDDRDGLGWAGL